MRVFAAPVAGCLWVTFGRGYRSADLDGPPSNFVPRCVQTASAGSRAEKRCQISNLTPFLSEARGRGSSPLPSRAVSWSHSDAGTGVQTLMGHREHREHREDRVGRCRPAGIAKAEAHSAIHRSSPCPPCAPWSTFGACCRGNAGFDHGGHGGHGEVANSSVLRAMAMPSTAGSAPHENSRCSRCSLWPNSMWTPAPASKCDPETARGWERRRFFSPAGDEFRPPPPSARARSAAGARSGRGSPDRSRS